MSLRAIVLDFDGVIANSEPLHFQAFRDVLAEEGVTLTEGDYYARYLGFDDVAAFQAIAVACGGARTTAHIGEIAARKAARLESLECEVSILFPGAAGAIASGARGVEIRRVLDREGLAACFTAIVAAGDTAAGKPEPDPYLRAVTLLAPACGGHLAASECVAIEDSHWGLESARAAGLRTVAVTHTYEAAALASADLVIASLDELDLRALARLCS